MSVNNDLIDQALFLLCPLSQLLRTGLGHGFAPFDYQVHRTLMGIG